MRSSMSSLYRKSLRLNQNPFFRLGARFAVSLKKKMCVGAPPRARLFSRPPPPLPSAKKGRVAFVTPSVTMWLRIVTACVGELRFFATQGWAVVNLFFIFRVHTLASCFFYFDPFFFIHRPHAASPSPDSASPSPGRRSGVALLRQQVKACKKETTTNSPFGSLYKSRFRTLLQRVVRVSKKRSGPGGLANKEWG